MIEPEHAYDDQWDPRSYTKQPQAETTGDEYAQAFWLVIWAGAVLLFSWAAFTVCAL